MECADVVGGEHFVNNVPGSDYSDWVSPSGRALVQVQDSNDEPPAAPELDKAELTALDVIGYTLNPNLADLKLSITDDVSQTAALNMSRTWTLTVSNAGAAPAVYHNNQRILVDNLHNTAIGYTALNVTNYMGGVTGTPVAAINNATDDLTVTANGDVTIPCGGRP